MICVYYKVNGDDYCNVVIIFDLVYGINLVSVVMVGMKVVVVKCDEEGNIDVEDLKVKVEENVEVLFCLMVIYFLIYGVFEMGICEICQFIYDNGGLVYMDGVNMNVQVGFISFGLIEVDVCYLNLYKIFVIFYGGGGLGMGLICVNEKLVFFLFKYLLVEIGGD